ncbi:ATP synthase F1 subunit delta [Carnobacterium sp. TMP28]|uniref:ATP synthase F1 subunit delta n=1 Tax=Carnobacterium sp. TMP28 TaxID=3397060 RepID=UPI0039DF4079
MRLNSNMNPSQLAKAFYYNAIENNTEDIVFDNLMDVRQIYYGNSNLSDFFNNRDVVQTDKEKILSEMTENFIPDVQQFVQTIYDFRQMNKMLSIIHEYELLHDHENRTVIAKVTTAVPLQKAQEEKLKEVFSKRFNAKKILLNKIQDRSVIGGVIVEIENTVFDGSIRTNLEKLEKQMVK